MIRLIAVPPFKANVLERVGSLLKYSNTLDKRLTFSKVSRIKLSSLACCDNIRLSYYGIV